MGWTMAGYVMENTILGNCRRSSCANTIPRGLATEQLCLDHFLDEAFRRTEQTLERCHQGQMIDTKGIEWLLTDALAIVNNLEDEAHERSSGQRDRMLELLLLLANVHEHVAHQSIRSTRLA